MDTRPQQEDGRAVVSAPLRVIWWWAKHPWVTFWGSLVLLVLLSQLARLPLELKEVGGWIVLVGMLVLVLLGIVSYGWGIVSVFIDKRTPVGKRVLKGLALGAIPVLLAAMVIPILVGAVRMSRFARAAADTKMAVTQAIAYGKDKGRYPTSLQVLREAGYGSTQDKDPWGQDYVLAPLIIRGTTPTDRDDVYVYTKGSQGTGTYPRPFTPFTGVGGSSGYSSIYGAWQGAWQEH